MSYVDFWDETLCFIYSYYLAVMVVGSLSTTPVTDTICRLNKTVFSLSSFAPTIPVSLRPETSPFKMQMLLDKSFVTLLHYLCSSCFQETFIQTKLISSGRKKIAVARVTGDDSSWRASSKSCEAAVIFQMLNRALAPLFLLLTGSNPPLPFFARRLPQPYVMQSRPWWC